MTEKTQVKTIFSIEDCGHWYTSGFGENVISERSPEALRQFQDTLIKAALQLERAIRIGRPDDEQKVYHVDLMGDVQVWATEDDLQNGDYSTAFMAAVLQAIDNCQIDGEPSHEVDRSELESDFVDFDDDEDEEADSDSSEIAPTGEKE